MMNRMDEAIFNAKETAVEERAREHGPKYASALEGFGDMARKLEKLQANTKDVKKKLERVSALMDFEDPQALQECLVSMEGTAASVLYAAARMYAAVRTMMGAVENTTGGDLLDMLEEDVKNA